MQPKIIRHVSNTKYASTDATFLFFHNRFDFPLRIHRKAKYFFQIKATYYKSSGLTFVPNVRGDGSKLRRESEIVGYLCAKIPYFHSKIAGYNGGGYGEGVEVAGSSDINRRSRRRLSSVYYDIEFARHLRVARVVSCIVSRNGF